jgi:hypothetical protein
MRRKEIPTGQLQTVSSDISSVKSMDDTEASWGAYCLENRVGYGKEES